ncbi:hypothetical protein GUITHDRAFT_68302, partial [Guillardia theta CCMP2712]
MSEIEFPADGGVIGRGVFGEVMKAQYRGTTVAVKRALPQVDLPDGISSTSSTSSLDETALSRLRHPCITTVMGAVKGNKKSGPMLVMEYMEFGSLHDIIHNETFTMDCDIVLEILLDIVEGMNFLHSSIPVILHGDLKSHNILVDKNLRAKVADFGFTQKKSLGLYSTSWMAPEVLRYRMRGPEADVYSFAILMSEIFSRREPYEGEDLQLVLEQVADISRLEDKRPAVPQDMPKELRGLMEECWHRTPDVRPPFSEIQRRVKAL